MPVKVGFPTVPCGVYSAEAVPSVPVKVGADAVALFTPVATVTEAPALGSVPAENEPSDQTSTRVSSLTDAVRAGSVQVGSVPALPNGLMPVVFIVTLISGAETFPSGVKSAEIVALVPTKFG